MCDNCKIVFLKRESFVTNNNFCSRSCLYKKQENKVDVNCAYCNKIFQIIVSKTKTKSGLNFCTRICKDSAQRAENGFIEMQPSHYGTGYSKYRDKALRTYPHECHVCKYKEHIELLQVHHIDSDRQNANLENLIVLCPTCHSALTIKKASMGIDRIWRWIG